MIPNQIDDVESDIHCSLETKAFVLQTDDYYRFVSRNSCWSIWEARCLSSLYHRARG